MYGSNGLRLMPAWACRVARGALGLSAGGLVGAVAIAATAELLRTLPATLVVPAVAGAWGGFTMAVYGLAIEAAYRAEHAMRRRTALAHLRWLRSVRRFHGTPRVAPVRARRLAAAV